MIGNVFLCAVSFVLGLSCCVCLNGLLVRLACLAELPSLAEGLPALLACCFPSAWANPLLLFQSPYMPRETRYQPVLSEQLVRVASLISVTPDIGETTGYQPYLWLVARLQLQIWRMMGMDPMEPGLCLLREKVKVGSLL